MENLEVIIWPEDRFNETISIKCLFIMRLLNYHGIRHKIRTVGLTSDMKKFETEARHIPLIKTESRVYDVFQFLELIKHNNFPERSALRIDRISFEHRGLLEWSLTNLPGLYLHFLFNDEANRRRLQKYILTKDQKASDSLMLKISSRLEKWSRHASPWEMNNEECERYVHQIISQIEEKLENSPFLVSHEISMIDISIFSFLKLLCSPIISQFRNHIITNESITNWMYIIDAQTFGSDCKPLNLRQKIAA